MRQAVTQEELEEAAGMFAALADPARLKILLRLGPGEMSVSDLTDALGEKLTTVSARLKVLYGARLVGRMRRGKQVFYHLADDHVMALVASAVDHACEDH
ncbi:ArsR/SmtB family transcription factor [Aquabacter spiritensis]|uniref:ArsR family transcriptional regulator n=1 Tax=Aquabacter spiritensis TaxID=933073 RepID=A0A4R3LR51_9HYPH|nr:metalloregulator ArsR/SmtB family transcription factor [Aquabacter spiritensis]TCT02186.1 ArsR family transcriptional regulator [Aquabacter spiritensis]